MPLCFLPIHVGVGECWRKSMNPSDGNTKYSSLCVAYALVSLAALARSLAKDRLLSYYYVISGGIYFIQVCIWVCLWIDDNRVIEFLANMFHAAALFYCILMIRCLFGAPWLFFMLKIFPIESQARKNKLHEVGSVAAICVISFLIRCFVAVLSAFHSDASRDVLDHPVRNLIFYMVVEILPSALVMYILRKLPPKRPVR